MESQLDATIAENGRAKSTFIAASVTQPTLTSALVVSRRGFIVSKVIIVYGNTLSGILRRDTTPTSWKQAGEMSKLFNALFPLVR